MKNKLAKFRNSGFVILIFLCFLDTHGQNKWPLTEWSVATPASHKMSGDVLQALEKEIASGKYGHMDEMFVTRHGSLVYQKSFKIDYDKVYGDLAKKKSGFNSFELGGPYNYYNPWWHPFYRRGELHSLQSVTKSIVSIIIGIAKSRGEFPDLSTPVLSFFDTTHVKNIDARKRKMTIRHLLTMTGGFEWEEWNSFNDPTNDCVGLEASLDWIQYTIDKPMVAEPGERFKYTSGGSHLLSYIFRKSTGKDIEEYAAQYLFAPLNINQYFWKRTPTGLADTQGGLYLKTSDLAKICYLFLREGKWNGKQLFTKEWVMESVAPSATIMPGIMYGYKWWLIPYGSDQTKYAWVCRGLGDQSAIIIPEYDIVAIFTGWNLENSFTLGTREAIRRVVSAITDK